MNTNTILTDFKKAVHESIYLTDVMTGKANPNVTPYPPDSDDFEIPCNDHDAVKDMELIDYANDEADPSPGAWDFFEDL